MPPRRLPAFALAALVLVAGTHPASAQPADQDAIDRSIEAGVRYLKESQKPGGSWGDGTGPGAGKGWGVGFTALAGIALIEAGTPTSDPSIRKAANVIRLNTSELDDTYEVALAILFLDRLKEKSDRLTIQILAGRLIAAQRPSGGWGYKVPKQTAADVSQLLTSLRKMSPPPPPTYPSARTRPAGLGLCIKAGDDVLLRPAPAFDAAKARTAGLSTVPPGMRQLPVLFDPPAGLPDDPKDAGTDNSNTHFAMLGLWASRKYDVPTDRTFALVNRRFRTSQGGNGTWAYAFARNGANGGGATTCIALLGVAIGYVVSPDPNVRPERDPLLQKAFVALGNTVGEPAGTTANRPKVKDVGGLYFMWAMERIAVLYDLRKLNKKDWYLWGAEILLGNQLPDGSWDEGGYPGQHAVLNTALAVLFLRRANLTPDLSRRLVLDTGALTAKVDDKPPPPKAEPPKTAEPPPMTVETPTPKPPEPKKEPPAPTPQPVPQPEPVADPAPAAPAKKTPWLFIVLGMLVAGAIGGGLAFVLLKKKNKDGDGDEEEEEKPKKKAKKKLKAKADDE